MKIEDKYQKVIEALKNNDPVLSDKEDLTDEIMQSIRKSAETVSSHEKMQLNLFAWAGNYWLRGSMAALALLFVGFFIYQQLTIANRLNRIEDQLVRAENTMRSKEPDLGIMQKVFLRMVVSEKDSITVSRADLEELMNSYLELQNKNVSSSKNNVLNKNFHRELRKNPEKNPKGDES